MAAPGPSRNEINIWDLDLALLRGAEPATPTVFYVNAKAVLLGESGVGKSGLGIRIAEGAFRPTESTHGAQFWHFPTERLPALPPNVQAELTLWDLAGQPEYRLTHQLFLDDTDAALLLFDCSDPNDPFRGVPYWAKVLKKHAPPHARKFLVSARCDVSPVTVDRRDDQPDAGRLTGWTSISRPAPKPARGWNALFERLMSEIPWDKLPRTSTPRLFQAVREFLLERKQAGANLIGMDEVRQAAAARFTERAATQAELDTVVQLLQSRGLVHRLDPRPGATWVLLKPERINQYGASIIQAARNHPQGIGAVPERDVLTGSIAFTGFERLPPAEETLVLEATAELLIRHDLGFREMGYLVFPSQINVTRLPPERGASAHRGGLPLLGRHRDDLRLAGGAAELHGLLPPRGPMEIRGRVLPRRPPPRLFHAPGRGGHRRAGDLLSIPGSASSTGSRSSASSPTTCAPRGSTSRNRSASTAPSAPERSPTARPSRPGCRTGNWTSPASSATRRSSFRRSVEEIYRRDPSLGEKQQQLAETVEQRTEAEVKQFRADQQQYTGGGGARGFTSCTCRTCTWETMRSPASTGRNWRPT